MCMKTYRLGWGFNGFIRKIGNIGLFIHKYQIDCCCQRKKKRNDWVTAKGKKKQILGAKKKKKKIGICNTCPQ